MKDYAKDDQAMKLNNQDMEQVSGGGPWFTNGKVASKNLDTNLNLSTERQVRSSGDTGLGGTV